MAARDRSLSLSFGLALLATTALFTAAASPGWLSPESGAIVRGAFSGLCHQLPNRSPHLGGSVWALCHRCSGIAAGLVLGLIVTPLLSQRVRSRLDRAQPGRIVVASLVPMSVDWMLGAAGIWANTPVSRVATGLAFGIAAGGVLALGLTRPQTPSSLLPSLSS